MKLLFDESLSPRLVALLQDLFPESESALRKGLAGTGDRRILEYAVVHDFVLVSTDGDFESLAGKISGAKVVILSRATIQLRLPPKCSCGMPYESLISPVAGAN